MHFVKFHPVVASCLLSRGKRKYAPLGMRPLWKYIRNYFLVYQLISPFLVYLQNYKEFEAEILDLQSEKYGLSFDIKKYTTSGWALGDENVFGIRAFKCRLPSQSVVDANWHLTLIPHLLGSHAFNWSSSMQMSQIWHFQAILQIDLTLPSTFICDLWSHELVKVPTLYQYTKFGSNQTSTFQMRWILYFEPILQLDLWWPLTLLYDIWPHEHTRGPILYQ